MVRDGFLEEVEPSQTPEDKGKEAPTFLWAGREWEGKKAFQRWGHLSYTLKVK